MHMTYIGELLLDTYICNPIGEKRSSRFYATGVGNMVIWVMDGYTAIRVEALEKDMGQIRP